MPQAAIVFSLVSLFGCQRVVIWPATLFLLLNLQLCLPLPLCRQSGGKLSKLIAVGTVGQGKQNLSNAILNNFYCCKNSTLSLSLSL